MDIPIDVTFEPRFSVSTPLRYEESILPIAKVAASRDRKPMPLLKVKNADPILKVLESVVPIKATRISIANALLILRAH